MFKKPQKPAEGTAADKVLRLDSVDLNFLFMDAADFDIFLFSGLNSGAGGEQ